MKLSPTFAAVLGFSTGLFCLGSASLAADAHAETSALVKKESASLLDLYRHLHANPELSFQEVKTSARLAEELGKAGFKVTTRVGGHGVVAVLKNGDGPTLLLRSDLDGLPVKEITGLPFASKARATDSTGAEVDVMHACAHDVHITCLTGAARVLAAMKDQWRGTLVLIGQPAEEKVGGARAMLKDGLFTRFPRPDHCVALHVASDQPAGTLGYVEGYALANVDTVDISVRGIGGHGAWPHMTKDPIVLAAQIVLALQTIVSREVQPGEPVVVTVGSIHGGAKHNIISDEVKLQLTLRSYSDKVRAQLLEAIRRQTRGLALAAGLPDDKLPVVTVTDESSPALYNDPALTKRLAGVYEKWFGAGNVMARKPVMGAEDFSEFGRTEHKIPVTMFWLGTVSPEVFKASMAGGKGLPALHSGLFRPDAEPCIQTGVTALVAATLELLAK
ncbi:MAG: amidohydrolase [Verrucomicrobia bacterium]|nr:amidohydrolase [Verrucomicrobiota bacterium]